ncbi:helix-turn-helix transcriptional regulator [Corynebacterium sp. J010B-136]|uniref:helix-turn-helix domain-containing protein n=1 Tax=Corynebacterium sp. J010B-136 TaxID=2099401 RepID=UPI000CF8AB4E|nr:helix-turn-helix transcriptional regulator [Corynebacterium sp. J010B-136]PQM75784.1 hypothetical protein C5Y44_03260 [Corynebacterium sp. J010B-136]
MGYRTPAEIESEFCQSNPDREITKTKANAQQQNPGHFISIARAALGITQKDLSGQLRITQAALSRYENNERHIEDQTLKEIGSLLGVNFDAFKDVQRPERGPLAAEAHMPPTENCSSWRMA